MRRLLVVFVHGLYGSPQGTKIRRLRTTARRMGLATRALDQRGLNPTQRIEQLIRTIGRWEHVILVGSSLGGYVASVAAQTIRPKGQFLLAPAFYCGFKPAAPPPVGRVEIVHGFMDDVVPIARSLRYGRRYGVAVHCVAAGHRLIEVLDEIEGLFSLFLQNCMKR